MKMELFKGDGRVYNNRNISMPALCFSAYFHPYCRCHDDSPDSYCRNCGTSSSASAAAKFSSSNLRSSEARNEASFATSSGLPHSSQRQRGCKARLEPAECESIGYDTSDRFLILMWQNRTADENLIQIGKEIPRQGELS